MLTEDFNLVIDHQIQLCGDVLVNKAKEYATVDRLHNFKVAAKLQGITPAQALAGFMAKHTVSIFDMCWDEEEYSLELWTEKITDHLNYLLLLKAILVEEAEAQLDTERLPMQHTTIINNA